MHGTNVRLSKTFTGVRRTQSRSTLDRTVAQLLLAYTFVDLHPAVHRGHALARLCSKE
jgi:hypothetical protein